MRCQGKIIGAGDILETRGIRYLVSDFSPGAGTIYGWPINQDNTRGNYGVVPPSATWPDIPESRRLAFKRRAVPNPHGTMSGDTFGTWSLAPFKKGSQR